MRAWLVGGLIAVLTAPAALAAPRLAIRGVAAQLVIVPEARSDIAVIVTKAQRAFPLRLRRFGDATFIDGDVGHRVRGCPPVEGGFGVRVRGLGTVPDADLPRLIVHTPLNVKVTVGDGVSGAVGRSADLDFENRGCGRWTIANVAGRLKLGQFGSGEMKAGKAGSADLNVAGGGAIAVRAIHGPLTAVSSGAGAVQVDSVNGMVIVRIAGSGSVGVQGGEASQLNVSIAGSGAVRFGGAARSLVAEVAGPGYVSVARVTGQVSRRVFGAGEIHIGR